MSNFSVSFSRRDLNGSIDKSKSKSQIRNRCQGGVKNLTFKVFPGVFAAGRCRSEAAKIELGFSMEGRGETEKVPVQGMDYKGRSNL